MRSISTDFAFTQQGLQSKIQLRLDEEGSIVSLDHYQAGEDGKPLSPPPGNKHIRGILSPGFVNAHCHLELSHMKGAIPTGTGMAGFIKTLQGIRHEPSEQEKAEAIETALLSLKAGGTVAIGDICNGDSTLKAKQQHPELWYRNFCEVFSLNPADAEAALLRGIALAEKFDQRAHPTLHAPYSMSPPLRDLVSQQVVAQQVPLSLHFLESKEERQLFASLEGPLMDLFRGWGLTFSPHKYNSVVDYVLEVLPKEVNTLLVHCTELKEEELERIVAGWPRVYFALCPLANDYIHGTVPPAQMMLAAKDRVCLGTDSLAGNHQLDMLAEMRHLQTVQSIPTETLLQWATLNGARALDLPVESFTLQVGAKPKLIVLHEVGGDEATFLSDTQVELDF